MNRFVTKLTCAVIFFTSGLVNSETLQQSSEHEFTAKIIAVLDGDTVLIRRDGSLVKIRLAEIDAPEKAQMFGVESSLSLSGMVLGKQVKVVSQAIDKYGRMVAHLSVDGIDVNAEQIRRGMSWAAVGWRQSRRAPTGVPLAGAYSNFHSNRALIALQDEAKQAPRGLWVQSNPIPPWVWRKQHPIIFLAQKTPTVSSAAVHAIAVTDNPVCGHKKYCLEMSSCDEARYYLVQCKVESLDGNHNGVPCETLCAPRQKSKN